MNANKCLRRLYPHAAEVCILLEVLRFQKLVGAELKLSTDLSTGDVEMFTELSLARQKAEGRKQKAESRNQKAEGRKQKAESRKQIA